MTEVKCPKCGNKIELCIPSMRARCTHCSKEMLPKHLLQAAIAIKPTQGKNYASA